MTTIIALHQQDIKDCQDNLDAAEAHYNATLFGKTEDCLLTASEDYRTAAFALEIANIDMMDYRYSTDIFAQHEDS